MRNRTTPALPGQIQRHPVTQPDNSSATRDPVAQSDNSSATRLRAGQSRCATGWHFPRVCASGSLICPVVQLWLHNRATKALPGCATRQLKRYPVAQPDNDAVEHRGGVEDWLTSFPGARPLLLDWHEQPAIAVTAEKAKWRLL